MAENPNTATQTTDPNQAPVLRPGRAADPVPATTNDQPAASVPAAQGVQGEQEASEDQSSETDTGLNDQASRDDGREGREEEPKPEKSTAKTRQRQLRLMLRQCDRVLLMNFELLAMNGWPDNYALAEARRRRDLWLFVALTAAVVFLSGLTGFVPAWIAGSGFGAFVIVLLLGVPAVRRIYTSKPSYLDLIISRRRMLREARQHIAHLEGAEGLIWQCARMSDFNPALRNTRFSGLLRSSENRTLARRLARREHIRLYLIYLLEAEKAYSRVQKAFLEGNQEAIDRGWEEVAAEPDTKT